MAYLITDLPDRMCPPQVKFFMIHPGNGAIQKLGANEYDRALQYGEEGWYVYRVTTQWERICTEIDRAPSESTRTDEIG